MPRVKHKNNGSLYLPELIEPTPGVWEINEVDIGESAVDTQNRRAFVPKPNTPAQRLARLHEGGHVKYSPRDWDKRILTALRGAKALDGGHRDFDPRAAEKIQKMLEENRIDWILWDRHGIDLRPCRETLDWGKMPDPPTVLSALGMSLQLAWTVWASRGLGSKTPISNPPPARTVDHDTGEYFDRCWSMILEEDEKLARTMIRACMRMYQSPTHEMRDKVAAELLLFFPLEEQEEEKPPPQKQEEQEAQDQAEKEEQKHEDHMEALDTGVGSEVFTSGHIQLHDHTAAVRRPSMRIARRSVPVPQGTGFRFAHRYFLDRSVFSQRLLTEAGIMIDGSGSMLWTDEDMQFLMTKLPAVQVGVYSGIDGVFAPDGTRIWGRICTIAKKGRFAKFTGLDPECNGANCVDYEALQVLATWPKPRLWLSDGLVCGGLHGGEPAKYHLAIGEYLTNGKLHEMCDAIMKRAEIYRVPTREVMHKLLNRERVRVYRSSTPVQSDTPFSIGPYPVEPMPYLFQL